MPREKGPGQLPALGWQEARQTESADSLWSSLAQPRCLAVNMHWSGLSPPVFILSLKS